MPDARRLYLHVGLQKTGTSYLQAALLRSRASLADAGLDLVPPTKRESFELMVVTRDRYAARRDPASDRNILDRFSRQLAEARGARAVYSQESLAAAGPDQIERLLGACGDREVHVVVTVRDLARGLPSAWQEELKAGSSVGFGRHLRRLRRQEREGAGRNPWIHLDPVAVLDRWGEHLPTDRLHVVTVPPSGSAPTLLLERFAGVVGVDPARIQPEDRPANTGLGLVQAEVLRRVNAELPEEVHRRYLYGDVVKRGFASGVLGGQDGVRILVPAKYRPWCEEVAERQIAALAAGGYDVAGSLDDLRCADRSFSDEPQRAQQRDVAAAAVSALAALLVERGTAVAERRTGEIRVGRRGPVRRLRDRLRER
ncbi:hypothetical protein GCM10027062_25640 [Nocardioides hungaricus]